MTTYVEPNQCPLHQFILLKFSRKNIESWRNWKIQFFWVLPFWFFFQFFFYCFIPMKISQRFLGSKDGSKFWWLPWFPAQNNTCAKICNTVYIFFGIFYLDTLCRDLGLDELRKKADFRSTMIQDSGTWKWQGLKISSFS